LVYLDLGVVGEISLAQVFLLLKKFQLGCW